MEPVEIIAFASQTVIAVGIIGVFAFAGVAITRLIIRVKEEIEA